MHGILERLVDSSLEDVTPNEPSAPSSAPKVKIQEEIDAGSGKCVYGWRIDSHDIVYDFLDSYGCPRSSCPLQTPFYTNLAM